MFAKAPVPGSVKTRLAGLLGADGAAGLHAGLTRHALATAVAAGVGDVELWCAPDDRHEFFGRCAADFGARLRVQAGTDLGGRMAAAFDDAFARGRALVLIGSDCPALRPADLASAAASLAQHEVAIAPAEDGGYVLVAMARPVPAIFTGVAWGTAAVMRQTRERLAAAGVRWKELATSWDVDRPEDYARLQREGLLQEVLS
ncbi:MAG: TIGR04282 family arsenosugar biosynthesis glycosyltransferase [Usitatibacter sp.]